MIRETPWHLRKPDHEHYRVFRNLVEIHAITQGWLSTIEKDQKRHTYLMPRVQTQNIDENLWMLEKLSSTYTPEDLDRLLDDQTPDELLGKLEKTIWIVHAWTLTELKKQTSAEEQSALGNLLEQSSWKSGRDCAQNRWKSLVEKPRESLQSLIHCFMDSPMHLHAERSPFLIRRATDSEVTLELLSCPHQSLFPEVRAQAVDLCALHTHWMRGFVYTLNTQAVADYHPSTGEKINCVLNWKKNLSH